MLEFESSILFLDFFLSLIDDYNFSFLSIFVLKLVLIHQFTFKNTKLILFVLRLFIDMVKSLYLNRLQQMIKTCRSILLYKLVSLNRHFFQNRLVRGRDVIVLLFFLWIESVYFLAREVRVKRHWFE